MRKGPPRQLSFSGKCFISGVPDLEVPRCTFALLVLSVLAMLGKGVSAWAAFGRVGPEQYPAAGLVSGCLSVFMNFRGLHPPPDFSWITVGSGFCSLMWFVGSRWCFMRAGAVFWGLDNISGTFVQCVRFPSLGFPTYA